MNDAWEERERALEEGYFIQKDHELIAKMKSRLAAQKSENDYECPKCDGKLHTGKFENVQVEICDKCSGVWLDSGELQQIMHKDKESWFGRLFG